MRLKKWVKVVLTLIILGVSIYIYSKLGYDSSIYQILGWIWLVMIQPVLYMNIWEN